ncbi:GNAT family N-acetyltransferase [Stenotrophobium rhamnosiphilum]|uniref:GNAT family N-acetyltransferase n=1 Tax=Stenotrophobium rhamnosiphilum TaxID=2029166 RepID=A0A2T5MHT4_9GAMM|nr:GNAT family protein [Stenotrophobium rhamnosiphilum]PTU32143.1 GNAT family N-acetyltransferase [Stenotrophobium rhamnosiphilum]
MAGDLSIPEFLPVTLQGTYVTLEPMQIEHHAGLCEAGSDEVLFRWFPTSCAGDEPMRKWIEEALKDQQAGKALPFVIRTKHDGRIVGSTRFGNIAAVHRSAEIGWTWYTGSVQRTPVNTECKILLLKHAFETLKLNRVELKTDSLNEKSRAAIARIGATQEGIFRNHMVVQGGRIRHTVYFSITREEWPQVSDNLKRMLDKPFKF